MGGKNSTQKAPVAPGGTVVVASGLPQGTARTVVKPTVAVIGGGLAGLHTAFELNRAGFDVTVLEARDDVGGGSMQCAMNCVNAPFVPNIFDAKFPRMIFFGLFNSASTGILTRETNIEEIFTRNMATWVKSRIFHKGDRDRVLRAGTWLGQQSVEVYRAMAEAFPRELAPALYTAPQPPCVNVEGNWSMSRPGEFLYVDAQQWAARMRDILSSEGVKILTKHRVEHMFFSLYDEQEFATTIAVIDSTEAAGPKPVMKPMSFDAYVWCTGSSAVNAIGLYQPLPILGMKGHALRLPLNQHFAKIIACESQEGQPMYTAQLSRTGFVYSTKNVDSVVVAGLLALDSRDLANSTPSIQHSAAALAAHMEVNKKAHLDERSKWFEKEYTPGPIVKSDLPDYSSHGVLAANFVRGVTPDGLPFVGPLGATQNAFVCAGFGDSELRWAPAAATLVRKFVVREEEDAKDKNPFSMHRFNLVPRISEGSSSNTNSNRVKEHSQQRRFDGASTLLMRAETALANPLPTILQPLASIEETLHQVVTPTFAKSMFGGGK